MVAGCVCEFLHSGAVSVMVPIDSLHYLSVILGVIDDFPIGLPSGCLFVEGDLELVWPHWRGLGVCNEEEDGHVE